MNEPKDIPDSEPPDAEDDDDAATKVTELPDGFMEDAFADAPPDVARAPDPVTVRPPPPAPPPPAPPPAAPPPAARLPAAAAPPRPKAPPRPPASPPESVQIRTQGIAASGEEVDVHGDTGVNELPPDPANAADAARAAQAQAQAQYAHAMQDSQNLLNQPQAFAPGIAPAPAFAPAPGFAPAPAFAPPVFGPASPAQHPPFAPPAGYDSTSPFAATAYAGPHGKPFHADPPAPVAVQAKFAPPYAAPNGGPASGIVWAIGGILVGLVLLAIIAFVLFWLLRS
jgi:hypothetical protein